MNNRGQTTILFSLIMGVLLLFTLSALEVGRIHLTRVKINPCVHSMRSSVMADYNQELFERYHLLFMDPTYGTGSEAVLEEKIVDYLETSLNGEQGSVIYQYQVDEIALSEKTTILSNDMKLLKQQIKDYERTAGVVNEIQEMLENFGKEDGELEEAAKETETNGQVLDIPSSGEETDSDVGTDEGKKALEEECEDPREVLKESLQFGILSWVAPGKEFSKESVNIKNAPSEKYQDVQSEERNRDFDDIGYLNTILKKATQENLFEKLEENASFASYVTSHFSNGVEKQEGSVMQCEVEYILKGKDSDYDNLEAVIEEMTWLRMPVNYAYLLTDIGKKSEALTLATAISVVTGTEPFVEIIKYLLLACWAYGESLQEMHILLSGGEIPYVKTAQTWYTDLESLTAVNYVEKQTNGLSYNDFLAILLAKKTGNSLDTGYARMLDVIQINLGQQYTTLQISDCVGSMTIQGRISVNPLFQSNKKEEVYDYYFEENIVYE